MYCGFCMMHLWVERFAQIPKGEFLEVPCSLKHRGERIATSECYAFLLAMTAVSNISAPNPVRSVTYTMSLRTTAPAGACRAQPPVGRHLARSKAHWCLLSVAAKRLTESYAELAIRILIQTTISLLTVTTVYPFPKHFARHLTFSPSWSTIFPRPGRTVADACRKAADEESPGSTG